MKHRSSLDSSATNAPWRTRLYVASSSARQARSAVSGFQLQVEHAACLELMMRREPVQMRQMEGCMSRQDTTGPDLLGVSGTAKLLQKSVHSHKLADQLQLLGLDHCFRVR